MELTKAINEAFDTYEKARLENKDARHVDYLHRVYLTISSSLDDMLKHKMGSKSKTADEDAKLLAKKEEEEREKGSQEKLRKQCEAEELAKAYKRAVEAFANMKLADMDEEPSN
ncbi:hypothetical protein BWQ96_05934 [Gracilariopsis chorda]|uniref:Uncharacterized protein n=1 Tax=Gracilariopsis chorda TaxID=448386 RepID=A0A2V3IRH0_9FLOR|nr:hypothetical protein BWQ96_05934 [Gracilariopsis chorda]|eukprot:PXF44307.1 hypothetical protein BWQ96_05934 [Gracilariopsis chorda]